MIRPVADLGLSAFAGAALAAPLILPGLQFAGSNRTVVGPDLFPKGLPPKELLHLIFQGFDGLPLSDSQWFGLSAYEATCAYVGVQCSFWPQRRSSCVGGGRRCAPCLGRGGNGTARVRSPSRVPLGQLRHPHLLDFRLDADGPCDRRSLRHGNGHIGQVLHGAGASGVCSASDSLPWRCCSGSSGLWPDEDLLLRRQASARTASFGPPIEVIVGLVVVWTLTRRRRGLRRAWLYRPSAPEASLGRCSCLS